MSTGSSGSANPARPQALSGRIKGLAERLRHLMPTRNEVRRRRAALRGLGPLLEHASEVTPDGYPEGFCGLG
jgi:hypothetical protein